MTDTSTPTPQIVVLVRDLMFSGRIGAEARAAGAPVRMIRDPLKLTDIPGRLLIVDLNLDGALEAARTWRDASPGRRVVAFVAHTDTELIAAARAAGIDQVIPRSRFVEVLPELLTTIA
ncbi:MAG: hypothetical protein H0T11_04925 [Chthoniobacterales bacterium]|nr:hypothetical protein [Chthoniobacterales bacterium]